MSGDDALRAARLRLRDRPVPGGWLATIVRAIEPATRDVGDLREHTPAHFLVAGWAPQPGGLFLRLPEFAAIASPDGTRALAELFVHLPPEVPVHLVDDLVVDPALVAEMVLTCDQHLEAYQRSALQRFVDARRAALRDTIAARYTDREAGFESFRARVLGPGGPAPK